MTLNQAQTQIQTLRAQGIPSNKVYQHIKLRMPELHAFIESYFAWPNETKSAVKLYWIENGLHEIPKCVSCGEPVGINKLSPRTGKYRLHCSHYCGCHSEHAREAFKSTCMQKYGAAHNMQSKKGLQEYSDAIRQKYGTAFTTEAPQVKEKIKQTFASRYGSASPFGSEDVKRKSKETMLSRYGVENAAQIDGMAEKKAQTCLEKYGETSYTKTSECKQKTAKTCLDKYGESTPLKLERCKAATASRICQQSYSKMLECQQDQPMFTLDEYKLRADDMQLLKFKCSKCGNEFEAAHHDGFHLHCPTCYPRSMHYEEKELAAFMQQLCGDLVCNTRSVISPLELDMYSPSKKLAVEFDGLYWHSDDSRGASYHLSKTVQCEQHGIQLVHVFENEWLGKQDIVKSRLKSLLGVYDRTVFARRCEARAVEPAEAKQFQEENHLQGAVNAKVRFGLYFNGELISLMTFGKCRFSKKHEWEMLRFCSKLGCHVVGAAGKLLKHFEKTCKPKSLVTYADRRWSQGKLYKALGFKLDHASPPNYWYWKDLALEPRLKFQKHKLKDLLPKYDASLSEAQNMADNGYRRIYDCGNLVYMKGYQ